MKEAKVALHNGIEVDVASNIGVDLFAMRSLVESGVPIKDIAASFHVSGSMIRKYSLQEGWLSPSKVRKMRREIEAIQTESFRRTGKALDVNEVKTRIWKERGEALKEKTYHIARLALDGVDDKRASKFIQNPLGLSHMTNVVRTITGEQKEDTAAPQLAVNIALLRSVRQMDVIEVGSSSEDQGD